MKSMREIIERSLVILLLADRGLIEKPFHAGQFHTLKSRLAALQEQVTFFDYQLKNVSSNVECELMRLPLGSLTTEQFELTQWQYESLPMLLWSVGLHAFPEYTGDVSCEDFHELLNEFVTLTSRNCIHDTRVDDETIQTCLEIARLWHWRAIVGAHDATIKMKGVDRCVVDTFGESYAHYLQQLPLTSKPYCDFSVRGKPYNLINRKAEGILYQKTYWRHRALEWVVGDEGWEGSDTIA